SLVIIGAGLLFIWPAPVSLIKHSLIVLSFIIPNVVAGEMEPLSQSLSNLAFLLGIAVVGGTGQIVLYRSLREQVLNQVRLEETKLRLKVAEHDLADYLRGLLSQVEPLAQRKGIELILRLDAKSTMVWCDLERIERVFLNLLSNATKFTQQGGHVQVVVRDAG